MISAQVQNAVVQWFANHTSLKEEEIHEMANENYFQKGWIDSLGFISFVDDMERQFGIRFSNDEFQERTFATIAGLAKIIEGKLGKQ